ncbi:unnamed protein product [Sphagnum balticum]
MSGISKDMDIYSIRVPLGVTAGITPFNFPAMIPLWVCCGFIFIFEVDTFKMQMFPMALVCGNTMIMKPSEQDPGACMMLVKLAKEAGVPDGCVNVIHGTHDVGRVQRSAPPVNGVWRCRRQCLLARRANGFPSSWPRRKRSKLTPVLCFCADFCETFSARISGWEPGTDVGPLISPSAKKRVCDLIEAGKNEGANLILDGRDVKVKGYDKGNFVDRRFCPV